MKQQTAIEWLETEFLKLEQTTGVHGVMYELIEKAKEMEKQQIVNAYLKRRGKKPIAEALKLWDDAEKYYTETYGKS